MKNSVMSYTYFVEGLLERVPELKRVYDEHINDNDELLEHVFMGDVTRFSKMQYTENPRSDILIRLLSYLNSVYAEDNKEVCELISVSFLENASKSMEFVVGIKPLLSDQLAIEMNMYQDSGNYHFFSNKLPYVDVQVLKEALKARVASSAQVEKDLLASIKLDNSLRVRTADGKTFQGGLVWHISTPVSDYTITIGI